MSTRAPLPDQDDRDLITTALDDTLIVEAAAGTGKTTELVRRIVRVIETNRANVTEIVAVTFTEKAAGELKLRLREALEEARRAAPPESGERGRLDDALRRLEEAQVSTIHGFCADLLRERPVEAGVDPLFTVLTESQATRMYDAAFQAWFQEQLVDPPEVIQRALLRPTFSGFGVSASEEGPVDRLRHAGFELTKWRDFDGEWQRAPFSAPHRIGELVTQLHTLCELLDDPASRGDSLYADTRPARQLSEDIRRTEAAGPRHHHRLEAAFIDLARQRAFQRPRKGTGRVYRPGVTREEAWAALDAFRQALARFEADANADLAAGLHVALRGCVDRYQRAKASAGALDFLDLLLEARNVIRDDAGVRRSFQRRFKRIFVDEFQDTDPLQAEILLLLAARDADVTDWRRAVPEPGKLFLVGDPKQSIYRFRRADVGIYREVYATLRRSGARPVTLSTSFRARPNIQRTINAAFEDAIAGNDVSMQAHYVPLDPFRADVSEQPSVVVLPVPKPYATERVANTAIESSLPDAVGAFVEWLVGHSGWKVAERPIGPADDQSPSRGAASAAFRIGELEQLVPIQARHICLLFRRFSSYGQDMTRPYVEALEARAVPHLLVGGRSFHNRPEIETLRAALAAIEWPDDELSVFATLRGALFAIGDEDLLEYRHRFGRFHPFHATGGGRLQPALGPPEGGPHQLIADDDRARFGSIVDALLLLASLHRERNHVPAATTITRLLDATRAHVRFALEHGGEQVLANVLQVAELARRYEAEGGISFRGFIEELRDQAEQGEAGEAPILEEGSDGVRLMTVHKAKGLEFPIVVLADMTAKLRAAAASRFVDPDRRVSAIRLAGCSPLELIEHEAEELQRDDAEGVRVAYVAATRARDLLVVPAVGDQPRDGWIEPLNGAIYPPAPARRRAQRAPGCPPFRTTDSVVSRPNGDPAGAETVCPGLHTWSEGHHVVWWDPHILALGAEPPLGIKRPELIVKDVAPRVVEAGLAEYEAWRVRHESSVAAGAQPAIAVRTATAWARNPDQSDSVRLKPDTTDTNIGVETLPVGSAFRRTALPPVETIDLTAAEKRPTGRRFGTLVHAVLASVSLDADEVIDGLAMTHGRVLGATDEEVGAVTGIVRRVLAHPFLHRARAAAAAGRCRREVPIALRDGDRSLIEGVIDLAFEEEDGWTVIDFKTDEELQSASAAYERQTGLYAAALRLVSGRPVKPFIMHV